MECTKGSNTAHLKEFIYCTSSPSTKLTHSICSYLVSCLSTAEIPRRANLLCSDRMEDGLDCCPPNTSSRVTGEGWFSFRQERQLFLQLLTLRHLQLLIPALKQLLKVPESGDSLCGWL